VTFYDTIESLINVDQVPILKRSGKGYDDARNEIHDDLAEVGDVEAVCYHEAAHFIYAVLLGTKLQKDTSLFQIIGPKIDYHSPGVEPEEYEATSSGLKTPGLDLPYNHENVQEIARIAVAGGEAVQYFHPKRKRGDASDRRNFEKFCKKARMRAGGDIEPPHVYWNEAARDVEKEFQLQQYNLLIEVKAELVKRDVFHAVFSNMKVTQ
jgi:hypothetical protein